MSQPDDPGWPYPFDAQLPLTEKLIGADALKRARPGFGLAAFLYSYGKNKHSARTQSRTTLARIDKALALVEEVARDVSDTNRRVLATTFDKNGESFVTGLDALSAAADQCQRARRLIEVARRQPRHTPKTMLAYGVGAALHSAGVELPKSRDGVFAEVLREVWAMVEPKGAPDDVWPYVQRAVDQLRRFHPNHSPRKGRPRTKK